MSNHLLTPMARLDVDASSLPRPIVCLVLAAVCLLVALHFLRRALAPVGVVVRAVAAAAAVAFATGLGLAFLGLAALSMTIR